MIAVENVYMVKFVVTGSDGLVMLFTVNSNVWVFIVFVVRKLNTLNLLSEEGRKAHCGIITDAPVDEVIEEHIACELTLG